MAARLLGFIRHLTEFLEILHSVRDDGQVSGSPGRKQRTIQVDIAGTVESVPQFTIARGKAVNCSPVRSEAHRFLLRYKAILFTDLTKTF